MPSTIPRTFVFCALPCEAKPLIQDWKLDKRQQHPFAIYTNAHRAVIVSGLGKVSMATAVGYGMALFPSSHPVLLNFGIAGHRSRPVGSIHLAHKVIDQESGKTFYPSLTFTPNCPTLSLRTCGAANNHYSDNDLQDMEATGFYEAAVRFSTTEFIHCLKIISDNADSPLDRIDERFVESHCARHLDSVNTLLSQLEQRQANLPDKTPALYDQLRQEFHFTVTLSMKLKALLERWDLLKDGTKPDWENAHARNAKQLIAWLEQQLDETAFYL